METEIISKIKGFLIETLMKEQAEFYGPDDELELDSLDQTELRVFLIEECGVTTKAEDLSVESLSSISKIVNLISSSATVAS